MNSIKYKCHQCGEDRFKLKKLENGILYTCITCNYEHTIWFEDELNQGCDPVKSTKYDYIFDLLYKRFGSNCSYEDLPYKIFNAVDEMKSAIKKYKTDKKRLSEELDKYDGLISAVNRFKDN